MDKISLIFVLAAVFSFAHVGEAVKCYECSYAPDAVPRGDVRCMDPFDRNSGVPNVTGCENGCIKATAENTLVGDIWSRGCNPESECGAACQGEPGPGEFIFSDCDCCYSDFCNGVGTIYDVSLLVTMCGSFLAIFVGHFK